MRELGVLALPGELTQPQGEATFASPAAAARVLPLFVGCVCAVAQSGRVPNTTSVSEDPADRYTPAAPSVVKLCGVINYSLVAGSYGLFC